MECIGQVPDVLGLTQEEGCSILQKSGYRVSSIYTYHQSKGISRIVRQRVLDKGIVELVISDEYYNDPSDDPSI
jgi:hypothetical protein